MDVSVSRHFSNFKANKFQSLKACCFSTDKKTFRCDAAGITGRARQEERTEQTSKQFLMYARLFAYSPYATVALKVTCYLFLILEFIPQKHTFCFWQMTRERTATCALSSYQS